MTILKSYLIIGCIIELVILGAYIKRKEPYTMAEVMTGWVIDILLWPFVIIDNALD